MEQNKKLPKLSNKKCITKRLKNKNFKISVYLEYGVIMFNSKWQL